MSREKKVRIFINSERYETDEQLFSEDGGDMCECESDGDCNEPERLQIRTEGSFAATADGRHEIAYDETELTGMEGAKTIMSYGARERDTVTMIRTGSVSTTLVFEKGKRHHCVYTTPYMQFEVCVRTLEVKNGLADGGELYIDYIVEIRGARAERTKFHMSVME